MADYQDQANNASNLNTDAQPPQSPTLRAPLPPIGSPVSPDALRQFYRRGIPQFRLPPVGGGVTGSTTIQGNATPVATTIQITGTGSSSSGGGGGAPSFSAITSGVNTSTNLTVGNGSILQASGTGQILATPGGVNTNVQYNKAGVLTGDSNFTWDYTGHNLKVTGTLNATVGFQQNGTAILGNVLRGNGTNFVSSAILIGDLFSADGVTTTKFLSEAGTWLTPSGGGGGVGAVSFATAASPATIDLTAVGTKDYLVLYNSAVNPPRALAVSTSSAVHRKSLGGWLADSFDWKVAAAGTIGTGGSASIAYTSTAGDDITAALSSATLTSTPNVSIATGHPGINYGFSFRVPADTFSRTLKLNFAVFSVLATVTCRFTDGSLADQTTTLDAVTNGGYVQKQLTITYNSGSAGAEMIVTVNVTTDYSTGSGFSAVYFMSATLA